jgi:hypothetical protein
MARSNADKAMEYVNYAKHCLKVAGVIQDRESRLMMREMAGEWMMLDDRSATVDTTFGADAVRPQKRQAKARS